MIKMSGRLNRSADPIAIIHMGEVDEHGRQDVSYKETPRFVLKQYVPDLKFRQSPPPHEMQTVAVEKFAHGNPMQLTELPLQFVHGTAERIFEVAKMCSTGYRKFGCVSRNPEDWADESDPRLVDLAKIQKYNTDVIPVATRQGMPQEWHHGHVAKRTIGRDTFVVPCPEEPHDCPYLRKIAIDRKTGRPQTWKDESPKYTYACTIRGILHASVQVWYPKASGGHIDLWTTSWDSIRNISEFLNEAEWFWSRIGVPLNYIRVILTVERTLTPDPDGKKQPQPLLRMKYDPVFAKMKQHILDDPQTSLLQLAAGNFTATDVGIKSQAAGALNPGTYAMPDEMPQPQTDVVYTINNTSSQKSMPKPQQTSQPNPPNNQPSAQSSGETITGKALVALKKAADEAHRTDEFLAARQDNAALIDLRDSLAQNSGESHDTNQSDDSEIVEAEALFTHLWEICAKSLKLPPQEKAIETILMIGKSVKSLNELTDLQYEKLADELEMLQLFADNGGTLEHAAKSTGSNGFLEHGWFGGGFVTQRRQALNALLDAHAESSG